MQLWKNTPPQNGVISKAPDTLELTFNEPVNANTQVLQYIMIKG